ncbi:hypothetical protein [Halothermothrix orenii]|uniref:hypothetical protein n=1 Tax=Halothermothrix orenii TaxID=31909 RepID=UPI0002D35F8E|nr:hypothetical protein [Halothermothrix orenii]
MKDNSYDACKVVKENFKLLEKKYNLFYDLSLKLKQIINNKDGQSVLNIIKKRQELITQIERLEKNINNYLYKYDLSESEFESDKENIKLYIEKNLKINKKLHKKLKHAKNDILQKYFTIRKKKKIKSGYEKNQVKLHRRIIDKKY